MAGLVAGSRAFSFADEKKAEGKKADTHLCRGHNDCKGKGGCKTDKNACAGKNECKGQGGCAVPVKHAAEEKKEKIGCSGKDGCKGA